VPAILSTASFVRPQTCSLVSEEPIRSNVLLQLSEKQVLLGRFDVGPKDDYGRGLERLVGAAIKILSQVLDH
jgi:hypothetical protein